MVMRKVIVSNLMALDGFFERPNKILDWVITDDEFFDYAKGLLRSADMLLFGRATYEYMASHWPTAPPDEIADYMNNLPKVVFSKTLKSAGWDHSRVVQGNIAEEVLRMKQQPGKDMVIFGSAMLASHLLQETLIDEYRVILQPVLLGSGTPLFRDIRETISVKLKSAKVFGSGVTLLSYQRA
jgi:dihydrofolate reductase